MVEPVSPTLVSRRYWRRWDRHLPPPPPENREGHYDGLPPSYSIFWILRMRILGIPDQQYEATYTRSVASCCRFVTPSYRITFHTHDNACDAGQILTCKVPYHYYSRDMQIVAAIFRGETPTRPDDPRVTDNRWGFIQRCWSPFRIIVHRPSSEEIVAFSALELSTLERVCHGFGTIWR